MVRARKLTLAAAMIVVPAAISVFAYGGGRVPPASVVALPATIELAPGAFDYRASGTFTRDGKPEGAPKSTITFSQALAVMTHQVTAADYRRCIEAAACPTGDREAASADRPAVRISWRDAHAYAAWLSRVTGVHFRLPTDAEWAFAAADRFKDDALPKSVANRDPGNRELAVYKSEASSDEGISQPPQPLGSFGANENGLLDLAGNVWEWTDTCFTRSALDARGEIAPISVSCGIRVVEGRHRTYLSDFIRDARGGGCSVGQPPSNLGFRLVRDDDRSENPWHEAQLLIARAQRFIGLGL
jgi:formylglycine-generating enzyme required for sulfatase activity